MASEGSTLGNSAAANEALITASERSASASPRSAPAMNSSLKNVGWPGEVYENGMRVMPSGAPRLAW